MQVVNQLDRQLWKKFVDEHPQGNVFNTPEMFDVYARAGGYSPALWAVLGEALEVLALFIPVQITLAGGPLKLFTSRNVAFGSVLTAGGEQGRQALAILLKSYNRCVSGCPLFTELRNVSDLGGVQDVLKQSGYAYEEHLNYLIDLRRDPYDILQSFSKSTRNHIRANLRRGVVQVRELTERADLPIFYELLKKTFQFVHVPLAPLSIFEAALAVLQPINMIRFTLAFIDGVPVAAMCALLYKDVIYGWYHGSNRAYGKYSINESLYWDQVEWGARHGFRVLDLGGAGKPEESYGVRDFKAKFNGQMVNYGRNICIHAPWRFKLSQQIYQAARKVLANITNPPERDMKAVAAAE